MRYCRTLLFIYASLLLISDYRTHIFYHFLVFPLHKLWVVKERMLSSEPINCLCNSRDGAACITLIFSGHSIFPPSTDIYVQPWVLAVAPEDSKRMVDRRSLCFLRSCVESLLLHLLARHWFTAAGCLLYEFEFVINNPSLHTGGQPVANCWLMNYFHKRRMVKWGSNPRPPS